MVVDITLRLLVALLLGGLIGIERDLRSKDAGIRTHFLVALGSALFCVVSQFGFGVDLKDSSRVAAQVVSGIGFLGAGTIIFQKDKNVVRGLTTAAGLWVSSAMGLACGTGLFVAAAVATRFVLVSFEGVNLLMPHSSMSTVYLSFTSTSKESVKRVLEQLKKDCVELHSYELKDRRSSKGELFEVSVEMRMQRGHTEQLLGYLDEFDEVTITSIE